MLQKVSDLNSLTVHATDGDVGRIRTALFDDQRWTVRYLVADTGRWLSGRRVLLSPISVARVRWAEGAVDLLLDREQVNHSPDITTDVPVSRQQEREFYRYYGYPHYWGGAGLWGPSAYPAMLAHADDQRGNADVAAFDESRGDKDTHLRDVSVVTGYRIAAADGDIGHVEDFLVDDLTWTLRYLVVDTSRWLLGGRHVIVSPEWVSDVSWGDSAVHVALSRDAIKASPEYDPHVGAAREYEQRLHEHYGRRAYWDRAMDQALPDLAPLEDLSHLEVADDEDVRGWQVVSADGRPVGLVAHLIVDPEALKVRYLDVAVQTSATERPTRDVLLPIDEVEFDAPAEQVRVRALSAPDVHALPGFAGLPIEADYERRLRSHFAGSSARR